MRIDVDGGPRKPAVGKHPDPNRMETKTVRPHVLQALYTIMLGNPGDTAGSKAVPETRFPESVAGYRVRC